MIERPIENLQGSVILKPVEAQLERNLHAFVKMDPYCVAMIGSTQIKGQVCKSGGLNPLWTDAMVLQLRNDEPLFLEVKDRQILSGDSTIGVCEIDLKSLFEEKAATKWYELYFKKKLAGKILIDATYTEENYGSRHVIYTNLKPVRKVEQPPPVAAKVVQKHMPGAQDTLVLPQDSMRGSAGMRGSSGMRFGSSPGSGKKENPVAHPESPTKAGLANSEALPITQPIVSQEPQNDLAKPAKTRKKSTGAKFLKSIKNMFDIKSTKKSQPQQPLSANPVNNDDIVPLTRTRPATQGYASTGGVPVINPNDGILERKLPAEPPKPSLKDYLSNENRNQMMLNRPVEPISQGNGFVRTLNPVTAEYTNDKLIDQYRSVGYRDQGEFRKVPDLRLSDRNLAAQDPGSGQKMTPDWKSNDVYGNGSIAQSQEVKPKRISDLLQNREVFNYR